MVRSLFLPTASGQYESPALNEKLYFHFRGFTKIENLDSYTQVRALWLEGNGIRKIEGLDNLKQLQCLEIQNLDSCTKLVMLDLSHNCIRRVQGLSSLPHLNNIKLAYNAFETLDDIRGLAECRALTNLDLSHNCIEIGDSSKSRRFATTSAPVRGGANLVESNSEAACTSTSDAETNEDRNDSDWLEDFVKLLRQLPGLTCLYFHGNPVIRKLPYYRKRIIAALPGLRYLDDRPVKALERNASEAWVKGGKEAETAAIRQFKDAEKLQFNSYLEDFRNMQNKYRENVRRALDRIAKEEERRAQMAANSGEGILTAPTGARLWTQEEQKHEIARADAVRRRWLRAADAELRAIEMPRTATEPTASGRNDPRDVVAAAAEGSRQVSGTTFLRRLQRAASDEAVAPSLLGVEHEVPTSVGAPTDSDDPATSVDDCGHVVDAALPGGFDELPSLASDGARPLILSETCHFVAEDQNGVAVRDRKGSENSVFETWKQSSHGGQMRLAEFDAPRNPGRRNPPSAGGGARENVSLLNDESASTGATVLGTGGAQEEKHEFCFGRMD
ncbi:putative leucine rich repeat protein [Neospora caninum Liverpool]|uniref:Putative leucine rich repeat protein n=1 Tax=Neospora caninum (strain Liverpool) TaxID=572307 RepID=F0VQT4_NEOCL|nr:putative leucine rich repeat protein [Neospora caninum Liverpool]CBZ56081.1 putative leucine rich repeat protein [Neospora caninum Liverpool]|eukprot:XP_003886107.1 putative leucine rich repeat protein [Neospora caninum Liverpool]